MGSTLKSALNSRLLGASACLLVLVTSCHEEPITGSVYEFATHVSYMETALNSSGTELLFTPPNQTLLQEIDGETGEVVEIGRSHLSYSETLRLRRLLERFGEYAPYYGPLYPPLTARLLIVTVEDRGNVHQVIVYPADNHDIPHNLRMLLDDLGAYAEKLRGP